MNVRKTAAAFSGTQNVGKVTIIRTKTSWEGGAGEIWSPTMRFLANMTFRYMCSHLRDMERNLLAGVSSEGLSIAVKVKARSSHFKDTLINR